MLIYNNLVINWNSDRYKPFLFNVISGRRRFLSADEYELIKELIGEKEPAEEAKLLVEKLISEKQFITEEMREEIEKELVVTGYWNNRDEYATDYRFSIELTRDCNMKCAFCYAGNRGKAETMTRERIDAIYAFYEKYADDKRKIQETPYIRITGGEPLICKESAMLVGYIADKWKNAKLHLFTNAVNLLKYYEVLPLDRLDEVEISLDGPTEVHLKHRFGKDIPNKALFSDIIAGIKKLLADNVKVRINTVLDRDNYRYFGELREFLYKENILNNPNCSQLVCVAMDFKNELNINESVNNMQDVKMIEKYLEQYNVAPMTFQSEAKLKSIISREENKPYMPKCTRCRKEKLANYFFACDGEVYHCDCIEDDIGVVGEFYPNAKIYDDKIDELYNSTILADPKCKACTYKYVCLGGCPLGARTKGKETDCGIFAHEEMLDNLEFDYYGLLEYRGGEETYEAH